MTNASAWFSEYMAALDVRDSREKSNEVLYNAYATLADRTAARNGRQDSESKPTSPPPSKSERGKATPSAPPLEAPAEIQTLRASLAAANKQLSLLRTQLKDGQAQLSKSMSSVQTLEARVEAMSRERAQLERKLRDRESELAEKKRLVENVQDEMVGMEMQMNVAEDKRREVEEENKMLVERWMKRVGEEARVMNEEIAKPGRRQSQAE